MNPVGELNHKLLTCGPHYYSVETLNAMSVLPTILPHTHGRLICHCGYVESWQMAPEYMQKASPLCGIGEATKKLEFKGITPAKAKASEPSLALEN